MATGFSATTLTDAVQQTLLALTAADSALAHRSTDERQREAEMLVLCALSLSRVDRYRDPQRPLTAAQMNRLRDWATRRAEGVPLAYLTGQREFWSLPLHVTPDVLVPRPETELLVERTLELGRMRQRELGRPPRILELGTGSGAIILALRSEQPDWWLVATDVSSAAIAVAQRNLRTLGLPFVEFRQGDWFDAVPGQQFDLIVGNPPYVAEDDPCLREDSLRFEPLLALTPGPDAMCDLRYIIDHASTHLSPGGWLLLEHGATQGELVCTRLLASGYTAVQSRVDAAGHRRASEGRVHT